MPTSDSMIEWRTLRVVVEMRVRGRDAPDERRFARAVRLALSGEAPEGLEIRVRREFPRTTQGELRVKSGTRVIAASRRSRETDRVIGGLSAQTD